MAAHVTVDVAAWPASATAPEVVREADAMERAARTAADEQAAVDAVKTAVGELLPPLRAAVSQQLSWRADALSVRTRGKHGEPEPPNQEVVVAEREARLVALAAGDAAVGGVSPPLTLPKPATVRELVDAVRAEGVLSPVALRGEACVFAEDGRRLASDDAVPDRVAVREVFTTVPKPLFRTTTLPDTYLMVQTVQDSTFGRYVPLACAEFVEGGELVLDESRGDSQITAATAAEAFRADGHGAVTVHGMSLQSEHPLPDHALSEDDVAQPPGAYEQWTTVALVQPADDDHGIMHSPLMWDEYYGMVNTADPAAAGERTKNKDNLLEPRPRAAELERLAMVSKRRSFWCFELPADTNLGELGAAVVFDNADAAGRKSYVPAHVGHFKLIPWWPSGAQAGLEPPQFLPGNGYIVRGYVMDVPEQPSFTPVQLLLRVDRDVVLGRDMTAPEQPSTTRTCSWRWGFPALAALFRPHCLLLKASALPSALVDDEAPGCDTVVLAAADALARTLEADVDAADVRDAATWQLLAAGVRAGFDLSRMTEDDLYDLKETLSRGAWLLTDLSDAGWSLPESEAARLMRVGAEWLEDHLDELEQAAIVSGNLPNDPVESERGGAAESEHGAAPST